MTLVGWVADLVAWLAGHPRLLLLAALTVPLWRWRPWLPGWGPALVAGWCAAWWIT